MLILWSLPLTSLNDSAKRAKIYNEKYTCNTAAPCSELLNTFDRGRGGSLGFVALSGRFGGIAMGTGTETDSEAGAGTGAGPEAEAEAGGEALLSIRSKSNE